MSAGPAGSLVAVDAKPGQAPFNEQVVPRAQPLAANSAFLALNFAKLPNAQSHPLALRYHYHRTSPAAGWLFPSGTDPRTTKTPLTRSAHSTLSSLLPIALLFVCMEYPFSL